MRWKTRVKIKHLYTEKENYDCVQKSMNAIADVLDAEFSFFNFSTTQFRSIPHGDSVFGPVDYANRLLAQMYDYADANRIWIE